MLSRIHHANMRNIIRGMNRSLVMAQHRNFATEGPSFRQNSIQRLFQRHHLGIVMVPQAEKWIIEQFGKYHKTLDSGLHFLIPFVHRIAYKHSTKECAIPIQKQTAITKDNVKLEIDGIVYIRITDAVKASYEVQDPVFAITQLAQTTMRAEIGKITLDKTFAERQLLNVAIVESIRNVAEGWGINIMRYEIKDITAPTQIQHAMELEAEAERKKRQKILLSEAEKLAEQNIAEGKRIATVKVSEAAMIEQQNIAMGEAFAIRKTAEAKAEAIRKIAEAISAHNGERAVAFTVAAQYVDAFGNLAKRGNTIIVPANVNDASGMITQAITIFDKIYNKKGDFNLSKEEALKRLSDEIESGRVSNLENNENKEKIDELASQIIKEKQK